MYLQYLLQWGDDDDEVTFQDMTTPSLMPGLPQNKPGYDKIERCCTRAREDETRLCRLHGVSFAKCPLHLGDETGYFAMGRGFLWLLRISGLGVGRWCG